MDAVVILPVPGIPPYTVGDMKTPLRIVASQQVLVHLGTDAAIDIDDDIGFEQMDLTPQFIEERGYLVFIEDLAFQSMQEMPDIFTQSHCPMNNCGYAR